MKTAAIVLFLIMYALMIVLKAKWRPFLACGCAILFLFLGILPLSELPSAIDWNILMMIFGTVLIVDYFIQSRMPNLIADQILDLAPNVMWVTIFMSLFAGIVSAFIDNVATVYMIAPVALAICKKIRISPVPMIISIAVSSNLQGAATLVGDTTSIMLAGAARMDFMDFFWFHGRPGVEDYVPTIAMAGHIVFLIGASFFPNKPETTNGIICMVWGLACVAVEYLKTKDHQTMMKNLKNADYATIFLLAGLFAVISGITRQGIIAHIADFIVQIGGNNYFLLYTVIVWISVLISALVDNIPYVATMLPVIASVSQVMQIEPYLLYYGLLIGATLGGNITPIGASANIAGTGLLRKEGYEVTFSSFMRIGVPFTLAAVIGGYLFLWFAWH